MKPHKAANMFGYIFVQWFKFLFTNILSGNVCNYAGTLTENNIAGQTDYWKEVEQ